MTGVKLLGALAQGMYWFLATRADLGITRGNLAALSGRRIGAAPWVEMGLRRLLAAAGFDSRANTSRSARCRERPARRSTSD